MDEKEKTARKPFTLAALLLIAHIVVNYQAVLSIFTSLSTLADRTPIRLLQFALFVVRIVVPIVILVLMLLNIFKEKEAARSVGVLCLVQGLCLVAIGLLDLYNNTYIPMRFLGASFFDVNTFGSIGNGALYVVFGLALIQLGLHLQKGVLRKNFPAYGIGVCVLAVLGFMWIAVPIFAGVSALVPLGSIKSCFLLVAAGLFFPGALLEGGQKAQTLNVVNLAVTFFLALFLFMIPSVMNVQSSYSSGLPEVTTVTCPTCGKKYTDNGNKKSIQRSNMCQACNTGFKATKDALGW